MAIQIGKYKRNGIFIEEIDNSVIPTANVEGITNMVIGVSKKGPINTPIRLTTDSELESIFGDIDRSLERKGSFFHRTIKKMLESSPVYGINLLKTDDELDTIQYKSLSTSVGFENDILRDGSYRRFFDTTGFWKRDTESFINLTENNEGHNERLLSITNVSDRYITVFIVKSAKLGYDRTLIEWYGSQEKLPKYVNANDYASDYMVDVVVVGGDWSNYQTLSVDTRWSQYFNVYGLIKTELSNFANDRNVTLLSYYEGLSLIPYFRDENGTNVFIENVINRDTDRTGLFCSFNTDLLETDYYNGLIDIIGHTIAGVNEVSIDFLSYKETISESLEFKGTPLDLPGNVTSMFGGVSYSYTDQPDHAYGTPSSDGIIVNGNNRTGYFGEGNVYGLTATYSSTTQSITVTYGATDSSFAVIGGEALSLIETTLLINASDYTSYPYTMSYINTFKIDTTGEISMVSGVGSKGLTSSNPTVDVNDIVLGYIEFSTYNGAIVGTPSMTHVSVDETGFVDYVFGASESDYYITDLGGGKIKIEFIDTNATSSVKSYKQYRRFKLFNRLVDLIDSVNKDKMTLCLGLTSSYEKCSFKNITISNIKTSSTVNKSFELSGLDSEKLTDILNGYLVIYTVDDEFIMGTGGFETRDLVDGIDSFMGIVSEYSDFYSKYYDGVINTGDYFYTNMVPESMITNIESYTVSFYIGTQSEFDGRRFVEFVGSVDPSFDETSNEFMIPSATSNTGIFTLVSTHNYATQSYSYIYEVNELIVKEIIEEVNLIYNILDKVYLRMYIDSDDKLVVNFVDSDLTTPIETLDTITNNTFYVHSSKSNYKQTIEIERPVGYVEVDNKILINASRYPEVKVGDFLEAYIDDTDFEVGQVGRKMTRILSKRQYSGDSTLSEVSCDAKIKKTQYGTEWQTIRYTTIDNYVRAYQAIPLKGFRIRQESFPNGTEARQSEILDLVAKGTPLFKAITNKEAIDFRYLIDSFGLGLIERSKQQLVDICGSRLDCFGIINMPSMKSFKNSSSPSFVDSEGVLQIEYVSKGGDPESSPSFLYSFGDGVGVSAVGYFLPYVTVNDDGRPVDVPPAAYVGLTYMRKHTANVTGITPWTISAGVTNGRILNIVKPEMDFTLEDLEWLNQGRSNPIVFKRNRGNVIENENTAQTLYKSALSYIHVREVLIELERELSDMLLDFQWKYNTPDIRSEIKLRADVICETFVNRNGLYNYFNKMDEENNTSEIIDNQIGILDTYVEPIKGMGIIVNNITILRTGAISAGGFMNP